LLFSAPGEPFSVRQRRHRWSTGARRAVGLVLAAPSVALALSGFFVDAPVSEWLLFVYAVGSMLWLCPVDRLFFRVERFRGMTPMRRDLWVAPALTVDGEDAGAPSDARVYVLHGLTTARFGWAPFYGLCLLCPGRIYEIVEVGAEKDVRRYAAALALGLHGDPARVAERGLGRAPWDFYRTDIFCAALSMCISLLGALTVYEMHEARGGAAAPWIVGVVGVFALLARASAVLVPLGRCADAQRSDRSKRFVEAFPEVPAWLNRRAARIAFGVGHGALVLVVLAAIASER
jgi:hypothetical protein